MQFKSPKPQRHIPLPSLILLACIAAQTLAAQSRDITVLDVAAQHLGAQAQVGRQYALFIAIDGYRMWPALRKPVADAREIRDILRELYYIDEVIEHV
jgi:hypothetical protein